ncbi:MAG: rhomboid family intramembrane serine protease, partial [Bacteroidota bacterium]
MLNRLTPIVKHLVLINVVVFLILNIAQMRFQEAIFSNYFVAYSVLFKSNLFHPVQIVTHFFAHIDPIHLIFNMFGLAMLGPAVEMVFGGKRFLRFYLFCGVVGGIFIYLFDPAPNPVLGASGAIFGVIAAFAYNYPENEISLFFMPP